MDLIQIPPEIIYDIMEYLPLNFLINIETVCKIFCSIIRNGGFKHSIMKINRYSKILPCIKFHKFVSYQIIKDNNNLDLFLKKSGITTINEDDIISYFIDTLSKYGIKCHRLILNFINLTEKSFPYLSQCESIEFSGVTKNIIKDAIEPLNNIKSLKINSSNNFFFDKPLKKLTSLTSLDLYIRDFIISGTSKQKYTDDTIKGLTNLRSLKLTYGLVSSINKDKYITNDGLKYLTKLESLTLTNTIISDVSGLINLTYLDIINDNFYITDDSIRTLTNLKILKMIWQFNYSSDGKMKEYKFNDHLLDNFKNLSTLKIAYFNGKFSNLNNLISLELYSSKFKGIENLHNLNHLKIVGNVYSDINTVIQKLEMLKKLKSLELPIYNNEQLNQLQKLTTLDCLAINLDKADSELEFKADDFPHLRQIEIVSESKSKINIFINKSTVY